MDKQKKLSEHPQIDWKSSGVLPAETSPATPKDNWAIQALGTGSYIIVPASVAAAHDAKLEELEASVKAYALRCGAMAECYKAVVEALEDAVAEARSQLVRLKLLDELGGPTEELWIGKRDKWQAALNALLEYEALAKLDDLIKGADDENPDDPHFPS